MAVSTAQLLESHASTHCPFSPLPSRPAEAPWAPRIAVGEGGALAAFPSVSPTNVLYDAPWMKRRSCPLPGIIPSLIGLDRPGHKEAAALPVSTSFMYSPPRLYPRRMTSSLSIVSSTSLASTIVDTPSDSAVSVSNFHSALVSLSPPPVSAEAHWESVTPRCYPVPAASIGPLKRKRRSSNQLLAVTADTMCQTLSFSYSDATDLSISRPSPTRYTGHTPSKKRSFERVPFHPPVPSLPHPNVSSPCCCGPASRSLRTLLDKAPHHGIHSHFLTAQPFESIASPHSDYFLKNRPPVLACVASSSSTLSVDSAFPAAQPQSVTPNQTGLHHTVRLGLVNRIIQINDHEDLQYHSETVYTAITYMDRYYSALTGPTDPKSPLTLPSTLISMCSSRAYCSSYGATFDQQLIAVTCLYLAAKFSEDCYVPSARTFAQFLTMYQCSTSDVIAAEKHILDTLDWNLFVITPHAIAEELLKCLTCSCNWGRTAESNPKPYEGPQDYPSPCESQPDASPSLQNGQMYPMVPVPSLPSPAPWSLASGDIHVVFPSPRCASPQDLQFASLSPTLYEESLEFWKLALLDHSNVGLSPTLIALTGLLKASQCMGHDFPMASALEITRVSSKELDSCLQTFEDDFFSDEDDEDDGYQMDL
ncbi:hypothetical protein H4R33_004080 [Dimargaris cristalligena]|uniref:Cyclin-like domain-containing protein n=1 Tax=Dimargaris cristalligena TaxID=215637 RepID=A0A4P9ZRB3_9FUNG|nr:hypothetical protein H4R33_004080 [Dimargaris cristalligena]RKP35192.1 hypothetical protein BJ085DRAFT_35162 [Dimargaris cristalligena]|eukprot:RKP35192.1 hypothetical protein BJ085DRAFT_35162 [Dimargaris cristalligena]